MAAYKIITCYNSNWWAVLSKLIRWIQGTTFSHFAIEHDNKVWDSTGKGIRCRSIEEFGAHYNITGTYNITFNSGTDEILAWLNEQVGTKYGFMQIFGLLLKELKIVSKNPWGKGVICNEFILMFLGRFMGITVVDQNSYDLKETLALVRTIRDLRLK